MRKPASAYLDPQPSRPLAARLFAPLLENPCTAAKELLQFGKALATIALGRAEIQEPTDARFQDPRWHSNPLRRRALQTWQTSSATLQSWIAKAPLSDSERQCFSFLAEQLSDALAPSHTPLHPGFIDRLNQEGGRHLLHGLQQFRHDLLHNHGLPQHHLPQQFRVGENLANTAGAVVFRHPMFELIQYQARTAQQHQRPLLIVPPQLNRFYIFDLSEQRSLVRHALDAGVSVFLISWKNPQAQHRHWGLTQYSDALQNAIEICLAISQSPQLNLLGACLGGLTCALAQQRMQINGELERISSCTYLVTPLDCRSDHPALLLLTPKMRELARLQSLQQGVLSGPQISRLFAWLRSRDLIWRYWTQNYLLGQAPEAFDILHWNADSTRLPAELHGQLLALIAHESSPPSLPCDDVGEPLDFSTLTVDRYAVAGLNDHITPWKSLYRSMQLPAGNCEFVLASSGHIQAILNPAQNSSGHFRVAALQPHSAEQWHAQASLEQGSWWPHWQNWLCARSGALADSPLACGNSDYPIIMPAPGSYVLQP